MTVSFSVRPQTLRIVLLVGAALIAGWLAAGTASASHDAGTVHVCVADSGGAMRRVGSTTCKSTETHLALATAASVTNLKARVATLETKVTSLQRANTVLRGRVTRLEAKLSGVTRQTIGGRDTLRLSKMNLQIVSGAGKTNATTNGTGNIIIGYNAQRTVCCGDAPRTGSHNLIVGDGHGWTRYGGIVAGHSNTLSGPSSSVTGGYLNTASGSASSVSGGSFNTASGLQSSISGGDFNEATGSSSSVLGGSHKSVTSEAGCHPDCS